MNRDPLLDELRTKGRCLIYTGGNHHEERVIAARSKGYRMGKTLGVKVRVARLWNTVEVTLRDTCQAKVWHGPGHQSGTRCANKGVHTMHYAVLHGMHEGEIEWDTDEVYA